MCKKSLFILLFAFCALGLNAKKTIVTNPDEFQKLPGLQAGDTIVLKNGVWKDAQLKVSGKGTQKMPAVVMAEQPGKVSMQGLSNVTISGEYITVSGLLFVNGYSPTGAVIAFKDSKGAFAFHCRVTNCAIVDFNKPERFKQDDWILLVGRNNRVDHCTLQGKLNSGLTLLVDLADTLSQKNYHQIDHNYFGPRVRLGSNGGESIRVGSSTYSLKTSGTVIEDNYFYQCRGEVEIVSIKACDNMVRRNKFIECEGSVVLRHGNNNTVESNFFDGKGLPYSGGVRIINANQKVYNNYFKDLTGTGFRAPISVMNGVPNSLINRYHQVKNSVIAFNTFKNCAPVELCTGSDNERTDTPVSTLFAYNVFQNDKSDSLFYILDNVSGITFIQNYTNTKIPRPGFETAKYSGDYPFAGVKIDQPDPKVAFITNDFALVQRKKKKSPGAFEENTAKVFDRLTTIEYGASYKIEPKATVYGTKQILKFSGTNPIELQQVIDKAQPGDEIVLQDAGTFWFEKPVIIRKLITISASPDKKPVFHVRGNKMVNAFLSVENGGNLTVKNIIFDGDNTDVEGVGCAISLGETPIIDHFNLFVDGCEFYNFNEGSYHAIKAGKSTYADTLSVRNSIFGSLTGDAINLASEKDDKGTYNAEYVFIENCLFYKVRGIAINIYRGGNDESTIGPLVFINHCTFDQVNNAERGSAVRLPGVQVANVKNICFSNSGRGGRAIMFDESRWDKCKVDYLSFNLAGRIESFYGKVAGNAIYQADPMFVNIPEANYQLQPNSPLKGKADDGKDIGCIYKDGKLNL